MRGGEVVELVLSSLVLGMAARSPAAAVMLALLMLFVRREARHPPVYDWEKGVWVGWCFFYADVTTRNAGCLPGWAWQ